MGVGICIIVGTACARHLRTKTKQQVSTSPLKRPPQRRFEQNKTQKNTCCFAPPAPCFVESGRRWPPRGYRHHEPQAPGGVAQAVAGVLPRAEEGQEVFHPRPRRRRALAVPRCFRLLGSSLPFCRCSLLPACAVFSAAQVALPRLYFYAEELGNGKAYVIQARLAATLCALAYLPALVHRGRCMR